MIVEVDRRSSEAGVGVRRLREVEGVRERDPVSIESSEVRQGLGAQGLDVVVHRKEHPIRAADGGEAAKYHRDGRKRMVGVEVRKCDVGAQTERELAIVIPGRKVLHVAGSLPVSKDGGLIYTMHLSADAEIAAIVVVRDGVIGPETVEVFE